MPKKEVRRAEAFRRWNAECREFFDNTTDIRGERNWELLHPMSLLYLAYLLFYLLLICPVMDMPLQTNAVRIFVVVQAFFTMWIFLHAKETPPARVVNMVIIVFAVQILGLSGFLGIAVFTNEASFLFPICLILMTQIYTWRPVFPITVVLVSAAVYLVFCWRTKDVYIFAMDLLSISCALGIAGVALFSVVGYKMRAYRAQTALQKMCALDPMTGVNNKATFEFLVEDFLRDFPAGRHALAVCDFDEFKNINDSYGHHIGDMVLEAFAGQLHGLVDDDPNLIAGRFGGDEFVIFFRQYETEQEVANQLNGLRNVPGFDFTVTISIGIAFSDLGKAGLWEYFDAADRCLYRVKAEGPGRIFTADADAEVHLESGRTK